MPKYTLNINGTDYSKEFEEDTPLLWVLRDEFELIGTKFGCGVGQCGACTIHLNGRATRSCLLRASALEGKQITTIEGISQNGEHPVQKAWKSIDVPQCGYCQSGQIMTATSFLNQNSDPTKEEIRSAMHGNICRCGAYNSIEKAVEEAAKEMSTK